MAGKGSYRTHLSLKHQTRSRYTQPDLRYFTQDLVPSLIPLDSHRNVMWDQDRTWVPLGGGLHWNKPRHADPVSFPSPS